jgi:hypothetical protein
VINGENAAYKAPKFLKPQVRTRNALIDDIVADFGKKNEDEDLSYKSPSGYSPSPSSPTRRGSSFGPLLRMISTNTDEVEVEENISPGGASGGSGSSGIGGMFSKRMWSRKSKQHDDGLPNASDDNVAEEDDDVLRVAPPVSNGRKHSIFGKR